MIVLGLLLVGLVGAVAAIAGNLDADIARFWHQESRAERAEKVAAWGATAAVFFLVLALLIWVVQ